VCDQGFDLWIGRSAAFRPRHPLPYGGIGAVRFTERRGVNATGTLGTSAVVFEDLHWIDSGTGLKHPLIERRKGTRSSSSRAYAPSWRRKRSSASSARIASPSPSTPSRFQPASTRFWPRASTACPSRRSVCSRRPRSSAMTYHPRFSRHSRSRPTPTFALGRPSKQSVRYSTTSRATPRMSISNSSPWIGGRLGYQCTPWMAAGPAARRISSSTMPWIG
jgi:hypothetical protein